LQYGKIRAPSLCHIRRAYGRPLLKCAEWLLGGQGGKTVGTFSQVDAKALIAN